jgi:hypothetical protein
VNEEIKEQKEENQQLLENYSGLKYYLPPFTSNLEDYDKQRLHSRNTSCCTLMFLILLLSLSCYILTQRRNVTYEFWLQKGIKASLEKPTVNGNVFNDMSDQTDFGLFVIERVAQTFFVSDTSDTVALAKSMHVVGPLRIRQLKVKETECPRADDFDITIKPCYYPKYSKSNRKEDDISDLDQPYMKFTSESENEIDIEFKGEFGTYDGSGYVADFYTDNMT